MAFKYNGGDYVKVINESSPYHELVGRVVNTYPDELIITIYGEAVRVNHKDVELRASFMSYEYHKCSTASAGWHTDNLNDDDIRELIDIALDIKDLVWAGHLYRRLKVK